MNVDLTLDTNAADIQQQAGILFFYDPFIDVPAGATAKASMRCPITERHHPPLRLVALPLARRRLQRVERHGRRPARDDRRSTRRTAGPAPTTRTSSMPVKGGSLLRFECDYDNTAGTAEYFAGQSAQTNEMCMFIGTYYPEMGQLTDFCLQSQDMFGTGGGDVQRRR